MGTRYNIAITATDAATARVRAIKSAIRSTIAPITGIGSSIKALGKETGINRLGQGIGTLARTAAGAAKSIGGIGGALAGATGLGSVAAIGLYGKHWLNAASATQRFSVISGVASNQVQDLRGAAKLAGLQTEDMDSAIQNLGTTLQDAKWGRNQGALLLMNRLGLRLKTTKTGAIDTVASLGDLADVLHRLNVPIQTKETIAQQFGIPESMIPLLIKGRQELDKLQRQAAKLRPAISPEDLERADQLRKKVDSLGLSFDNIGNSMATRIGPVVGGWIDYWTASLNRMADSIRKKGFWAAVGENSAHNLTGMFRAPTDDTPGLFGDWNKLFGNRGPAKADPKAEKESIDHFKRMGWTDAQAKGIVANMMAESKLDPKAVGDNGAAQGALQWHRDRQNDYANWAKEQPGTGKTVGTSSLADQRRFIDFELRKGKERRAGEHLMQQSDPRVAAAYLSEDYVRPRDHLAEMSHRGRTAADLDKRFPSDGKPIKVEPVAPTVVADRGATDLASLWKNTQPNSKDQVVHLKITAPPGTRADVTDRQGPVKTTLKTETSMPDL